MGKMRLTFLFPNTGLLKGRFEPVPVSGQEVAA